MKTDKVKYIILLVFGFGMLYKLIPLGDYCLGLLGNISFIIFAGLFIISAMIIVIINIIKIFKKKDRFDFYPIIITFLFFFTIYHYFGLKNKKFWTKPILSGFVQVERTTKSGSLILYKNKSFATTLRYADLSCTYQGDYEINNKTLILKRDSLAKLTEQVFTTKYTLNLMDSVLIPENKNFSEIKLDFSEIKLSKEK